MLQDFYGNQSPWSFTTLSPRQQPCLLLVKMACTSDYVSKHLDFINHSVLFDYFYLTFYITFFFFFLHVLFLSLFFTILQPMTSFSTVCPSQCSFLFHFFFSFILHFSSYFFIFLFQSSSGNNELYNFLRCCSSHFLFTSFILFFYHFYVDYIFFFFTSFIFFFSFLYIIFIFLFY